MRKITFSILPLVTVILTTIFLTATGQIKWFPPPQKEGEEEQGRRVYIKQIKAERITKILKRK